MLEDELGIIEESNKKFQQENENLKSELNDLNYKVLNLNNEISSQKRNHTDTELKMYHCTYSYRRHIFILI